MKSKINCQIWKVNWKQLLIEAKILQTNLNNDIYIYIIIYIHKK